MTKKEEKRVRMNELPLIPREVWPEPTAVKACSIWTSLPEGLKVVRENEYWLSPMIWFDKPYEQLYNHNKKHMLFYKTKTKESIC